MRYFYNNPTSISHSLYKCNAPMYSKCTLFCKDEEGLAVVQQRFNRYFKYLWWGPIDQDIAKDILRNERFETYFESEANFPDANGIFPTVTIRQLMWALRMKPLRKEFWEKDF